MMFLPSLLHPLFFSFTLSPSSPSCAASPEPCRRHSQSPSRATSLIFGFTFSPLFSGQATSLPLSRAAAIAGPRHRRRSPSHATYLFLFSGWATSLPPSRVATTTSLQSMLPLLVHAATTGLQTMPRWCARGSTARLRLGAGLQAAVWLEETRRSQRDLKRRHQRLERREAIVSF